MIHINREIEIKLTDLFCVEGIKTHQGTISDQVINKYKAKYIYDKDIKITFDLENKELKIIKNGEEIIFLISEYSSARQ